MTEYPTDVEKVEGCRDQGSRVGRSAPHHRGPTPILTLARTRQHATLPGSNFLGIVFYMMFGTAALPHILMRYYTTPSVQQARDSLFWSLFFIFLLYFTAPCSGGAREVRRVQQPSGQQLRLPSRVGVTVVARSIQRF